MQTQQGYTGDTSGYSIPSSYYYDSSSNLYPGLQQGQAVFPSYCQQYFQNNQAGLGNYYSNNWNDPYSQGVPYGYSPNCQYPIVCQYPSACSYIANGVSNYYSQFGNTPTECQYPYVCSNPSACSQLNLQQTTQSTQQQSNPPAAQYKIVAPPAEVRAELTKEQFTVTATYTGDEYFFNGGLPSQARGEIVIRDSNGFEKKRIPFVVSVEYKGRIPTPTPSATTTPTATPTPVPTYQQYYNYPVGYPSSNSYYGYSTQIPPECQTAYYPPSSQQAQTQQQQQQAQQQFLQLTELPDSVSLKVNVFTGKAHFEKEIKTPPQGGSVDCKRDTGVQGVSCGVENGKLVVEASLGTNGFDENSGSLKLVWTLQADKTYEIPMDVIKDDFVPQKIQLFSYQGSRDYAEYTATQDVDRQNCRATGATVVCDGPLINVSNAAAGGGSLAVSGLGDDQTRNAEIAISQVSGPNKTVARTQDNESWVAEATFSFSNFRYSEEDLSYASDMFAISGTSCGATFDFQISRVKVSLECLNPPYAKENAKIIIVGNGLPSFAKRNNDFEIPFEIDFEGVTTQPPGEAGTGYFGGNVGPAVPEGATAVTVEEGSTPCTVPANTQVKRFSSATDASGEIVNSGGAAQTGVCIETAECINSNGTAYTTYLVAGQQHGLCRGMALTIRCCVTSATVSTAQSVVNRIQFFSNWSYTSIRTGSGFKTTEKPYFRIHLLKSKMPRNATVWLSLYYNEDPDGEGSVKENDKAMSVYYDFSTSDYWQDNDYYYLDGYIDTVNWVSNGKWNTGRGSVNGPVESTYDVKIAVAYQNGTLVDGGKLFENGLEISSATGVTSATLISVDTLLTKIWQAGYALNTNDRINHLNGRGNLQVLPNAIAQGTKVYECAETAGCSVKLEAYQAGCRGELNGGDAIYLPTVKRLVQLRCVETPAAWYQAGFLQVRKYYLAVFDTTNGHIFDCNDGIGEMLDIPVLNYREPTKTVYCGGASDNPGKIGIRTKAYDDEGSKWVDVIVRPVNIN
jgi:hypothetical protein